MTRKISKVVVYTAVNKVNGNCYIGVTKSGLDYRANQHRRLADQGKGYLLHSAMRKHGHANIEFKEIFDFDGDYDLALLYEIEAIAKYKPAYNITNGGEGFTGPRTANFSPEHRANLSRAAKGKKKNYQQVFTEERRQKISRAHKGNTHWLGKKHRDETKNKIRAAGLKRTRPELWVPVMCVNDGKVFPHAGAAADFYGVKRAWLRMCINRDRALGNGLRFVDVRSEPGV